MTNNRSARQQRWDATARQQWAAIRQAASGGPITTCWGPIRGCEPRDANVRRLDDYRQRTAQVRGQARGSAR